MWTAIYHGYISFAVTLFEVVGAFSVCCIACLVLLFLARVCYEYAIAFKNELGEYRKFKERESNDEK